MQVFPRQILVAAAVLGVLAVASACSGHSGRPNSASDAVELSQAPQTGSAPASGSGSPSASGSAPAGPSSTRPASASAPSSTPATGAAAKKAAGSGAEPGGTAADPAPATPDLPVPAEVGNATQLITVKANGSYATVTAWAKGSSGWKAQFSTGAGRVGSNGITEGMTRRQGTYTTPTGTYTVTEGFGVESGSTAMPYHQVTDDDWWVEDPESKFYNSMHGEQSADFPLTESGDRGSEHLINYPTQYAKALVINFNRWPATPGRGAGIFLHVNGNGATAGCVSVPRATMDRIMGWITPSAHPRIAIG